MNVRRFDTLSRSLSAPRRSLLAGVALAAASRFRPSAGEAKKRGRRRTRKSRQKLATCDCRKVGQSCTSVSQCCSGICQGPQGQRTCRAHGTGTCDQGASGVCAGDSESCNGRIDCLCYRTMAGSNFCAEATGLSDNCTDCETDADCVALGYPAGSACVPFSQGDCAGTCETDRACKVPCGTVVPLPKGGHDA